MSVNFKLYLILYIYILTWQIDALKDNITNIIITIIN